MLSLLEFNAAAPVDDASNASAIPSGIESNLIMMESEWMQLPVYLVCFVCLAFWLSQIN